MKVMTQRWVRRGGAVGVLLLAAVMLSACIEANSQSTIGSDLKGTTKIRIGFSKVALQAITQIGSSLGGTPTPNTSSANNPFADLTTQASAMGGTVTPYETADFTGVEISMQFSSLDEMVSQINNALGSSSSGSSPLGGGSGSGALATITTSSTADRIRIDGDVDPLSELNDPSAASAAGIPGLDLTSLLAGGGKVEIAFTMPGTIRSTDPLAKTSGTTVSWSFNVGDKKATIFVESDKG